MTGKLHLKTFYFGDKNVMVRLKTLLTSGESEFSTKKIKH